MCIDDDTKGNEDCMMEFGAVDVLMPPTTAGLLSTDDSDHEAAVVHCLAQVAA